MYFWLANIEFEQSELQQNTLINFSFYMKISSGISVPLSFIRFSSECNGHHHVQLLLVLHCGSNQMQSRSSRPSFQRNQNRIEHQCAVQEHEPIGRIELGWRG